MSVDIEAIRKLAKANLPGWQTWFIANDEADEKLLEDLRIFIAFRWYADSVRHTFEELGYYGELYGPDGNFQCLLNEQPLPTFWKERTDIQSPKGIAYSPNKNSPMGKWLAVLAEKLPPQPPAELVAKTLKQYGFKLALSPTLSIFELENGFLISMPRGEQDITQNFSAPGWHLISKSEEFASGADMMFLDEESPDEELV